MKKIIFICLIMVCLFSCVYGFFEGTVQEEQEYVIETTSSLDVPKLNARAAILYDATYGRILYEKNSKSKRANASTTKMLTAIVAYEEGNLDDMVTVSQKSANTGGSSISLRKGDKLTLNDLIKGLLVHSGNDAAVAIAEHISGSVEEFAKLMNSKAEEIGARDTHFVTPHGLDASEHYSTAHDLMLIASNLLEIPYLADIVSKTSVELSINNQSRIIGTTNEMLSIYNGADGVKTGFTGDAGRCIVTSATQNNRKLISVVLGCDTKKDRTMDSVKLLNYGYNAFKEMDLKRFVKESVCITIEKSEGEFYKLTKDINLKYPLKEDEISKIRVKYNAQSNLVAPVEKGKVVATTEIFLDSVKIGEIIYSLPEKIERKDWKTYFKEIVDESFSNKSFIELY